MLQEGQPVEGLLLFPIEDYVTSVLTAFPAAVREPNGDDEWVVWISPNQRSSFQVTWSSVHVQVTCRSIHRDDGNRLVDIAISLGAPLYDPQTGERFDSWVDS
jgi:hypothetical protein